RKLPAALQGIDLSVFSPPYPNSFDYTDVYNLELWTLRYLKRPEDNLRLRLATLSSHVQIKRAYSEMPNRSPLLRRTVKKLTAKTDGLWDARIPDMVGGYFADLSKVIVGIRQRLTPRGQIWMVVGDSRYAECACPWRKLFRNLLRV